MEEINFDNEVKNSDDNIREELLDLAIKGEIRYKENYIKKASNSTLEKIYADYQKQQLRETNEMFTDAIISKFSELMERLDMINSAASTGKKLQEKKMLRRDLKRIVSYVTPHIPLVGFIEGGLSVVDDMVKHKFIEKPEEIKKEEE